jgi:galactonate dehydratase
MVDDVPWRDAALTRPLDVRDGRLHLSERPGLGVELVDEVLEAHPGIREPRPGFYV